MTAITADLLNLRSESGMMLSTVYIHCLIRLLQYLYDVILIISILQIKKEN